jgi:hypothetical protein
MSESHATPLSIYSTDPTDIGSSNYSVSSIFCYEIHDGFQYRRFKIFVDNVSVSSMPATHLAHSEKNEKCNHFC